MKVVICGYKGKMGSLVYQRLFDNPCYEICGLIEANDSLINILTMQKIDVVIDFTNASNSLKNAYICLDKRVNYLSGTTGIDEQEINLLAKKVKEKQLSFLICPNFSLGINLLLKTLSLIKPYFKGIQIIEQHHISKLDKPSGTAIQLKKQLNNYEMKIKSIRKETNELFHKIILKRNEEKIEIKHTTTSRESYVDGVIYGLEKIGKFKGLKRTLNF